MLTAQFAMIATYARAGATIEGLFAYERYRRACIISQFITSSLYVCISKLNDVSSSHYISIKCAANKGNLQRLLPHCTYVLHPFEFSLQVEF